MLFSLNIKMAYTMMAKKLMKKAGKLVMMSEKQPKQKKEKKQHRELHQYKMDMGGKCHPAMATKYLMG